MDGRQSSRDNLGVVVRAAELRGGGGFSAVDLAKQNLDPLIADVPDFQKLLAKDRELEAILGTVSVWRGVQYRTVLR